jgi:hypothetical protein
MSALRLDALIQLAGGRFGTFDVPCPLCGPLRHSPANRRRKVMRIWRHDPSFVTFHCARCGETGYARNGSASPAPDPAKLARVRAELAKLDGHAAMEQSRKAAWLWRHRQPIAGSIAEIYLRAARGYGGPLPATLAFLPAGDSYSPAMIAAFGHVEEPEPGVIAISDEVVCGVHITKLKSDGSGKAGTERDKIMVGASLGLPIVLAPINDLLGLAVCEGIEDTLSTYEATGLGAWAAGAASRLPALAQAIPEYVECTTVMVDDDHDGRRHAIELGRRTASRGIEVRQIVVNNSVCWSIAA